MGDTPVAVTGMQAFVNKILETLTTANLWETVLPIAGIVVVLLLFKLGYGVLKKNVNSATKVGGKAMK